MPNRKVVDLEKLHNFYVEHFFILALDQREILIFSSAPEISEYCKTSPAFIFLLPSLPEAGAPPLAVVLPRRHCSRPREECTASEYRLWSPTRRQPLLPPPLILSTALSCSRHARAASATNSSAAKLMPPPLVCCFAVPIPQVARPDPPSSLLAYKKDRALLGTEPPRPAMAITAAVVRPPWTPFLRPSPALPEPMNRFPTSP